MAFFFITILLSVFTYYIVRYSSSQINTDDCPQLDPNATIVAVRSEPDNWGKYKHIKTIVQFSDGSQYHTYYTRQEPGLGYTTIVVDEEVVEEIKEKAIIAHRKKVDKQSKTINKTQNIGTSSAYTSSYWCANCGTEGPFGVDGCKACGNTIKSYEKPNNTTSTKSDYDKSDDFNNTPTKTTEDFKKCAYCGKVSPKSINRCSCGCIVFDELENND